MRRQKTEDRRQKLENRSLSSVLCPLFSALCLLVFAAGCENLSKSKITLAEQIDKLNEENSQLQKQIEQVKSENEELRDQVQVLSSLPEQVKGENLYYLQRIKISGYTNLYDKDKDGKKEKLIVYLQPIDQDGDIIKATGDVDVQLWDLSKKQDKALLGQWHVKPEQLKKLWLTALMTHYKLTFDVADKVDEFKESLTVKITFTDHLTGKVFKEQKIIEPR
jgi:cell division protein FtsB